MPKEPRSPAGRRMDIKDIKVLVQLMVDNDLGELEIADGATKVHLKRQGAQGPMMAAAAPAPVYVQGPAAAPAAKEAPAAKPAEELLEIRSPMVGTFYTAPSPDSEAFVQVGAAVRDDSVVCIVEAMKVMNEIKAECSGVIREICVKNAQPVEFGQVLFRVKAS
jgi:acetyl-CoA carboxylase biotin carboxyl carrier protein